MTTEMTRSPALPAGLDVLVTAWLAIASGRLTDRHRSRAIRRHRPPSDGRQRRDVVLRTDAWTPGLL
jgi:hypothetical protein